MQDLIAKAATLLEALPYIQKFSGQTFVVKLKFATAGEQSVTVTVKPATDDPSQHQH